MTTATELITLVNPDPAADLIAEYARFRNVSIPDVEALLNGQPLNLDPGLKVSEFYAASDDFLINLIRAQITLRHLTGRVSMVVSGVSHARPLDILDIGGGLGNYCIALARKGHRCRYADIPGVITDFARHRFEARNLDIEIVDVRTLPEKQFNVLLSFDVLEHLEDVPAAMVEYAMHCAPDGLLILSADFLNLAEPFHLPKNLPYAHCYETLLSALGFSVVHAGGFTPLESIIKAATRVYTLKQPVYDRSDLTKRAQHCALQELSRQYGWYQTELKRLGG